MPELATQKSVEEIRSSLSRMRNEMEIDDRELSSLDEPAALAVTARKRYALAGTGVVHVTVIDRGSVRNILLEPAATSFADNVRMGFAQDMSGHVAMKASKKLAQLIQHNI